MPDDGFDSEVERAAAKRAALFATHKARGSLGTYYEMFPDEKPIPRPRQSDGQDRER